MRTKISVEIHKLGEHSDLILKAVAVHNEGKRELTPNDIQSYLKVREAIYNGTTCDLAAWGYDNNELNITSDQAKTFSISLTWKEVHELSAVEQEMKGEMEAKVDDIPKELFKQ